MFADVELISLPAKGSLPDTEQTLHLAKVIKSLYNNKEKWYEVKLLTDNIGKEITNSSIILIPESSIVKRISKKITPKVIYVNEENLVGKNFVIKSGSNINVADNETVHDTKIGAITSTSRNGLGSGIYGLYNDKNQIMIDMIKAYVIQNQLHGEAITKASLETNRYLDNIIRENRNINHDNIALKLIENNDVGYLVTLWNIVFYFSGEVIARSTLENILAGYLIKYYQNDLFDEENNPIIELPINFIMINMGYTGLISNDIYGNSWDRGCVSYNYDQATKLIGNRAPY